MKTYEANHLDTLTPIDFARAYFVDFFGYAIFRYQYYDIKKITYTTEDALQGRLLYSPLWHIDDNVIICEAENTGFDYAEYFTKLHSIISNIIIKNIDDIVLKHPDMKLSQWWNLLNKTK